MILNIFADSASLAADAALPALDPMPERALVRRSIDITDLDGLSVGDFIVALREATSTLTPEERESAFIDLGTDPGYWDSSDTPTLKIGYNGLETNEEYVARCLDYRRKLAGSVHAKHRKIEAAKEVLRAAGITTLGEPQ